MDSLILTLPPRPLQPLVRRHHNYNNCNLQPLPGWLLLPRIFPRPMTPLIIITIRWCNKGWLRLTFIMVTPTQMEMGIPTVLIPSRITLRHTHTITSTNRALSKENKMSRYFAVVVLRKKCMYAYIFGSSMLSFMHTFNRRDKESPLDFSLSSSAFDPYTSAASAYWSHHHSQGQSQQYHHHHHNHSSSTHAAQYYSNTIKTESVLSPSSVTSPSQNHHQQQQQQAPQQSWSLSISSSKSQVHISTTNISPVSNSSSSTSLPGRKRFKKGGSMVSSSGSESSTSASPPPSVAQRGTFSDSHHGHSSSSASVATASISSGHTARTRNIYKGLDGENSSTMVGMTTCPLTPSPVWEGQTQRVPDLATITHHSHNGHSGHGHPQGERDLTCYNNINSSELIHCVPTYLPYSSGEYR